MVSVPPQKEATPTEKYSKGGETQRLSEHDDSQEDLVMETERGTTIGMEVFPTSRQTPIEVIPETKLLSLNGNGKVYKEILASIGLDSPTSSHDTRGNLLGEEQGL